MKRIAAIPLLLIAAMTAGAQQQIRIWHDGDDTRVPISANSITYSTDGTTFECNGNEYSVDNVDSITMVHIITVNYSEGKATVEKGNVMGVTYTVDGANVTIDNTNTHNEVEVVLQGNSNDGSLTYYGQYKCKFYLNGLNLTSTVGAALNIQCGKRVDLIINPGTDNILTDAAGGMQKAALYCKGHLEISGSGNLTVSGNTKHAIASKEYMQLKKSTGNITIAKAAADAIHVGQYFIMNGGNINIDENTANDGIQVEIITLDDDITPDPSKENNHGTATFAGGSVKAVISHEDCKGIKCDGNINISGGTFDIKPTAGGSRGIQTDANMVVGNETAETSITIATSGGKCTQPECKADPHRCMGIKVDGNLTVNGGTIKVTHSKSSARDIKIGGTYTKNGGTVTGVIA